mmetsp:Transcript_55581/g.143115  ORF Transcript_55581/g.143115 Transcript_55581/m.143115 type:complete len:108 (-) Transcript_55581:493-816(-)
MQVLSRNTRGSEQRKRRLTSCQYVRTKTKTGADSAMPTKPQRPKEVCTVGKSPTAVRALHAIAVAVDTTRAGAQLKCKINTMNLSHLFVDQLCDKNVCISPTVSDMS